MISLMIQFSCENITVAYARDAYVSWERKSVTKIMTSATFLLDTNDITLLSTTPNKFSKFTRNIPIWTKHTPYNYDGHSFYVQHFVFHPIRLTFFEQWTIFNYMSNGICNFIRWTKTKSLDSQIIKHLN